MLPPCVVLAYRIFGGAVPSNFDLWFLASLVCLLAHALPVCVTSVLLPQAECANVNGFVQCHHLVAGGWKGGDSQRVFLRPEAVAEWERLNKLIDRGDDGNDHNHDNNDDDGNDGRSKVLHIEGPPGTGKSTIAWAWACFKAQDTNVLWIHRNEGGGSRVCLLGAGYVVYFDFTARRQSQLGLILSLCASLVRANVVVVDGITDDRKDLFHDTARWANVSNHHRAVLVTSAQIVVSGQFDHDYGITTFSMPSWTLEQYQQACADDAFFEDVKRRLGWKPARDRLDQAQAEAAYKADLLEDKFGQAGFSARWMFSLTSQEVADTIRTCVRRVHNYAELAAGLNGDRSPVAVGHLIAVDAHQNNFFVSVAVMRAVVDKCEAQAVTVAARLAVTYDNGSFDGWVFEFDFLMRLRLAHGQLDAGLRWIRVEADEDDAAAAEQWPVERRHIFYDVGDLDGAPMEASTWYLPKKSNQGGYDAVMVTGPTSLRFVQLTVADHHSRKLKYLREFGTAWQANSGRLLTSVELVAVVPAGALDAFQWDHPEGSVPAAWNLTTRTVSFRRAGVAPINY